MKIRYLWSVLILSAFFPVTFAQIVPVPQSGVNWQQSTLSVLRFQPSDPSHRESFSCFGASYENLPLEMGLAEIGFTSPDNGPLTLTKALESQACFQQSGWYEVLLKVYDYAGNQSEYKTALTVVPAALSLNDSTINPVASKTTGGQGQRGVIDVSKRATCTSQTLIADGEDECVLEVNLRDRFGNVVKPEGVSGTLTLNLPTENAASDFDASRNAYGAFLAGLYFPDNQKSMTFNLPQSDKKIQVGLRAYVPSLENFESETPLLSSTQVMAQPVKIDMQYEPEDESMPGGSVTKTFSPLFSPWVQMLAAPVGSIENYVRLPLNRSVKLPLQLSSAVGKTLPNRLLLDWAAPELESLWLQFDDDTQGDKSTFKDVVSVTQNPQPYDLQVSLVQPEGGNSETAFRLQPLITYAQNINDTVIGVRYPASLVQGSGLELLPPLQPLLLRASIEGKLITESSPTSSLNLILSNDDKILFSDWRRRANRNFISLIRGQSPRNESTFNLNTDFGDDSVAYFKGVTLTITGEGREDDALLYDGGVKTIIVEDGNVLINRDLLYKTTEDSLGIIVINSRPGDLERGHLFVNQRVGKISGSYFLDGAIISTDKIAAPSASDIIEDREATPNQDRRAPLGNQLVLEGTLVARNTLGGSDLSPAEGPNGQKVQRALALIYDLNYLRRYEPLYNLEGERVSDLENDFCHKIGPAECYPNPAPFVIRYDGRVQAFPPPGFEADS